MVQNLEIKGVHAVVDDNLRKYISKKIGGVDRYMSRHDRECVKAEVHVKESKTKDNNHCVVEVTLHVPQQTIVIKEKALNMYAAIDIVSAKLKLQLKKHKDLHQSGKMHRQMFARFRRQNA